MEPGQPHGAPFAGGYSNRQRIVEGALLLASSTYWCWLVWRLAQARGDNAIVRTLLAFGLGMVFADFLSGLVHWGCDTWGSIDTPLLGRTVIRTFREHHIDAKAITRHDLIETNGSTAVFGSVPALCAGLLPYETSRWAWFVAAVCVSATLFVTFTSQIHKWAHEDQPPRLVALLQNTGILLSTPHHDGHHTPPYVKNYCITTGWMNRPLEAIQFFPVLERVIEKITGTPPRYDPAAEALARATGVAEQGFFVQNEPKATDASGVITSESEGAVASKS